MSDDYDYVMHIKVSRPPNGTVVKEDCHVESSPAHLVSLIKKSAVEIDYAEYLNDDVLLSVQIVINELLEDDEIHKLFLTVNEYHTGVEKCDLGIIISVNTLEEKTQFIKELKDNNFTVNALDLEE